MEMLILVDLCIFTVVLIERQNASMRRMKRVRIESHGRNDR